MKTVTEDDIIRALEGKFFRGPSSFYQLQTGQHEEVVVDQEETKRALQRIKAEHVARVAAEIAAKREQAEREAELSPARWRVPIPMCVDSVCVAHCVTPKEFHGHGDAGSKTRRIVVARQHASWLIKALRPDVTFVKIGQVLSYKDHSTVMYGIKKFEELKSRYMPEVAASLEYIREKTGDRSICLL